MWLDLDFGIELIINVNFEFEFKVIVVFYGVEKWVWVFFVCGFDNCVIFDLIFCCVIILSLIC